MEVERWLADAASQSYEQVTAIVFLDFTIHIKTKYRSEKIWDWKVTEINFIIRRQSV